MSSLATTHCAIENCRTTILNKSPGVSFHSCPSTTEMRNRWLKVLKNKCSMIDWSKSRICSKHFEQKYFDSNRMLKDNAVPTIFASTPIKTFIRQDPKTRVDRLLNKLTQAQLTANIKQHMSRLKEPTDLDNHVTDDLRCRPDTPLNAQLWLAIKKQDNLITRLMDLVVQTNKHVEILEKSKEETTDMKREQEKTVESLKYIVKCLQDKHITLEEQIEILTAVESR